MDEPTWGEDRSARWVAEVDLREAQLAPVSDWLFETAALHPGETVLDVGCGPGSTTARAAAAVAPGGSVTGLDVSAVMLAAARERHAAPGIDWLQADPVEADLGPARFDAVISRFGVMFFGDAARAFAHLAAATEPGGRLALAVWQLRDRGEFFEVPYAVSLATLDRLGVPYEREPPDANPFGFGQPHELTPWLSAAGWQDLDYLERNDPLYLGGPAVLETIVAAAMKHGPMAHLENQPAEVLAEIRADLHEELGRRHDGVGVPLAAGVMIITGRRGS